MPTSMDESENGSTPLRRGVSAKGNGAHERSGGQMLRAHVARRALLREGRQRLQSVLGG